MEHITIEDDKLRPFLGHLTSKRASAALALPSMLHALTLAELVEDVFPLHSHPARSLIWRRALASPWAPVEEIQAYLGTTIPGTLALLVSLATQTPCPAPPRH
mmetsp:Transcript_19496/g.56867  ORF Transcript_19496/g.56867 Transcript_19496/m.56867 type:complete len:103 (+) Transcript_19496:560-868(+)